MRLALFAVSSLAPIFLIAGPSLSGLDFKVVPPGTWQETFQVSVTEVLDDGVRPQSPALASRSSPGWGGQAYQFSVTGDFAGVEPGLVVGFVRLVSDGVLLAKATLEPRWKDAHATFEVTVSGSAARESELNIVWGSGGPAATFYIFPMGDYIKRAD